MIADFMAVAGELRQMIIIRIGIGADQGSGFNMINNESIGNALR
jgi:hypothetical protein